jgi:hypothetical protein
MKKTFTFLASLLLILLCCSLFAQTQEAKSHYIPFKAGGPGLYGLDVIIDNQPSVNQREVCLSVATNGWLYAAFNTYDGAYGGLKIFRSTDDGETWMLIEDLALPDWREDQLDIVVAGYYPDLKLFVAGVAVVPSTGEHRAWVDRYNGVTGAFETEFYYFSSPNTIYDIAIASDYKWPAVGASPYSVAALYSMYTPSQDELYFISSSDGGYTMDNIQTLETTGSYYDKVSLSYGKCWNYFNGRYFAAWEKTCGYLSRIGQIWSAHCQTFFNGAWTAPLRLDDLAGSSAENMCRNPSFGTQFNETDNDLSNVTGVVLFDRDWDGTGTDYDLIGVYNKEAVSTDNWTRFDIRNDFENVFQSDINFDPVYNNFLVTFCDSTNQSLDYVIQWQNLPTPDTWSYIATHYNEVDNLVAPYPKVEINPMVQEVAHVWNGNRPGGNGMATFDAEYSTLGIPGSGTGMTASNVNVFPNPCSTTATLFVNLTSNDQVSARLLSVTGQEKAILVNGELKAGENRINFDVTNLQAGYYLVEVNATAFKSTERIVVTH